MAAFSTFLRFLKWKMDGKWKMEDGKWKTDSSTLVGCYEAVATFAKWPFRLVGLI